jgi:hypothetical protein
MSNREVQGGTYEVTGEITRMEHKHNPYNGTVDRQVMWVTSGGLRYWGTTPRPLWHCEAGDVVTFTADFEQSPDNPSVGFFKRPRKARVEG